MKSIYLQNNASHNNVNWIEVVWFLGFDVEVEEKPFSNNPTQLRCLVDVLSYKKRPHAGNQ